MTSKTETVLNII
uniref:Uncharacterized protein n=1 Tax=Anguilla anguilla TaxID=7936 RepID=A0A0E9RAW3_ANGAN